MNVQMATLDTCHTATGVVVVIDVCRAFSTAAFAIAAGAQQIILVESVEEALATKARFPGSMAMGELGGLPVPGFDLWNSPQQFETLDVTGRTLVQRTSAGTQGVVRSKQADRLLATSFVVAGATVRYLQSLQAENVTFVPTDLRLDAHGQSRNAEDVACAEYMASLLRGETPSSQQALRWVPVLLAGRYEGQEEHLVRQFKADVQLCAMIDRFSFAMEVQREDGLLVLRPVRGI